MNSSRWSPRREPAHLGPALRRAWIGYQRRLDDEMAAAGFGERGFPDGRVLRMCRAAPTTTAQIGRELGITRQGASKVVARLQERGYVQLQPSPTSAREKTVSITPRAIAYLDTQRNAARRIERRLRRELGDAAFDALASLLDALGGADQPPMRDDLRQLGVRGK
jgi:DNA-binding MarR family transcriptional regulator